MEEVIQKELLHPEIIWERPVHFYKNQAGRIFIIAGSARKANHPIQVCEAVFRSGTGIITLGFPEKIKGVYQDFLPEAMMLPLDSTPSDSLSQKAKIKIMEQALVSDATIIGPGISENAETTHLAWELITEIKGNIIVTTDALLAFIKGLKVMRDKEDQEYLSDYFKNRVKGKITLVLNMAELTKLAKTLKVLESLDLKKISTAKEKKDTLTEIVKMTGVSLVLNDQDIIFINPQKIIITPGLSVVASAHKNEILAAITTSFIGQNPEKPESATTTAVYLYSTALKIAKKNISDRELVSADIVKYLPEAVREADRH